MAKSSKTPTDKRHTKPHVTVVAGGSGTGKTAWVLQELARLRPARVLVWDVKAEYSRADLFSVVTGASDLARLVHRSERGWIAFVPGLLCNSKVFGFWSRCALAWGSCVAIAEETADVTSPGKAPPGWGELVRRGRDRKVWIYAITQAPSESDKTVMRNHTLIHCGALKRDPDRAYMAREMRCHKVALDRLLPLDWLESDEAGNIRRGRLGFGPGTPGKTGKWSKPRWVGKSAGTG